MQNTTKVKIATFTFENPTRWRQMLANMQRLVEAELGIRNRDASWSGSHASILLGVEPGAEDQGTETVRGEIHNDFDSDAGEWTITGWAWL